MIIELPALWLVVVNILAWLFLHLFIAMAGTQLPPGIFNPNSVLFRARTWEKEGRFYERFFSVRRWKDRMPDGATWFKGGFPKASLKTRSKDYIERFARETCRGEAVHWTVMAAAPLFFVWNPPVAGLVMLIYGVSANLPCIIVQRYNRNRLMRIARTP